MRRSPTNWPVQKGDRHERVAEPIPRPMVLQVSHSVGAEISKTSDIWAVATWDWEDTAGIVPTAKDRVDRGACVTGPRTCAIEHTAEVQHFEHNWVPEREVSDKDPSSILEKTEELQWVPLLGTGVLCKHGRVGRTNHQEVHTGSARRGNETREPQARVTSGPFEGPSSNRPLWGR